MLKKTHNDTGSNFTFAEKSEPLSRYQRHHILEAIGKEGQAKICSSRILIIGMGGLGSPLALYLAAAGVGHITVADADEVSLHNLQRQVVHRQNDIGKNKAQSAAEKMREINPEIQIDVIQEFLKASNIESYIKDKDFVIDATDNFKAKFLINDACVKNDIPFSHAGVVGMVGQTMTVIPHQSACYRCLFGKPPAHTLQQPVEGIFSPLPGIVGSMQAAETLKFLSGAADLLVNRILILDVAAMSFREVKISRSKQCPACGRSKENLVLEDMVIS